MPKSLTYTNVIIILANLTVKSKIFGFKNCKKSFSVKTFISKYQI